MEFKIKPGVQVHSEDFWYDLTYGGYIKPEEIIEDPEQVLELKKAIKIVLSFQEALDDIEN